MFKRFSFIYIFILIFNIFAFSNINAKYNSIPIQSRSGDITELENGDILSAPTYTPSNDGVYQLNNGDMLIISQNDSNSYLYYSILDIDTNTVESTTYIESMTGFKLSINQSHNIGELPNGNIFVLGNENADDSVNYVILDRDDGSLLYEGTLLYPDGYHISNDFSINSTTGTIFTDTLNGTSASNATPVCFKPVEGSDYTQWTGTLVEGFDSDISSAISDTLAINGSENFLVSSQLSSTSYEYYLYNSDGEKIANFTDSKYVSGTKLAYLYALDTPNTFLWFEETGTQYYLIDFNNLTGTPINITGITLNKALLLQSGNILLTDQGSGSYVIISTIGDIIATDSITDNSTILGFGVKSDKNIYAVHQDWSYTLLKQSNFPPEITNLEIENIDNNSISIDYEVTESETSSSTSLEIFDVGADGLMNTEDDESVKLIDFTESALSDTTSAIISFEEDELEKQFFGKLEFIDANAITRWVYSSEIEIINIITPTIDTFNITNDVTSLTINGSVSDTNLLVTEIRVTATDQDDIVFNLTGNTNTTISGQAKFENLTPDQSYDVGIIVTYNSFGGVSDTVTDSKTISTLPIPVPTISSFVLSNEENSIIANWSINDTDLLATSVDIKLNTDEEVQSYDLVGNTETTVSNTTTFEGLNFNTSYNVEIVVNYDFESTSYSINQNDSITTSSVGAPTVDSFTLSAIKNSITLSWAITDENLVATSVDIKLNDDEEIQNYDLVGNTETTVSNTTTFEGLNYNTLYEVTIVVNYLNGSEALTVTQSDSITTEVITEPEIVTFELDSSQSSINVNWSIYDEDLVATSLDIKLNTNEEIQSYDLTGNTETTISNTTTFEGLNYNTSYNVEIVINYPGSSVVNSESIYTIDVPKPTINSFEFEIINNQLIITWDVSINQELIKVTKFEIVDQNGNVVGELSETSGELVIDNYDDIESIILVIEWTDLDGNSSSEFNTNKNLTLPSEDTIEKEEKIALLMLLVVMLLVLIVLMISVLLRN